MRRSLVSVVKSLPHYLLYHNFKTHFLLNRHIGIKHCLGLLNYKRKKMKFQRIHMEIAKAHGETVEIELCGRVKLFKVLLAVFKRMQAIGIDLNNLSFYG